MAYKKSDDWQKMDECNICGIWQKVQKGHDGKYYCSIHITRDHDKKVSDKRAKQGIKWLDDFRSIKESNPV